MHDPCPPYLRELVSRHRDAPASPLVVLAPTDAVGRSIRAALLRHDAGQAGVWITTPTQFARVLGRTHPSARTARLADRSDTYRILMDALDGISERVRDRIFQGQSLESVVEAMTPLVRRLRENDISPATLYALSLGRSLSPAHRALVVGYEAYDRELLNGSMAGPSDVFGWATAQVRNGRIAWLGQTTLVAFDDTTVGAAGAVFLNAVQGEAKSFVRLGAPIDSTHAPSETLASHDSSDRAAYPDASDSTKRLGSATDEASGVQLDSLSAAVRWIQERVAESDVDVSAIDVAAPERLVGELADEIRAAGMSVSVEKEEPDAVHLTSFDRAGFSGRDVLFVVTVADNVPDAALMSLLTEDDWARLAELSEAPVAPKSDAVAARNWQLNQVLWRHDGRATVLAIETPLPEEVSKDAGGMIEATTSPVDISAVPVPANHTKDESLTTNALKRWVVDAVSVFHVPGELERIGQASHLCSLLPDEAQDQAVDPLDDAVQRLLDAGFSEWLADAMSVHPVPIIHGRQTEGGWVCAPIQVAVERPTGWCLLSISDAAWDENDASDASIADSAQRWAEITGEDVDVVARFGESDGWREHSFESMTSTS